MPYGSPPEVDSRKPIESVYSTLPSTLPPISVEPSPTDFEINNSVVSDDVGLLQQIFIGIKKKKVVFYFSRC